MLDVIHMTAAYSNAVMVAILPHFSEFAQKLDIPAPNPITTNHVAKGWVYPIKDMVACSVTLTNGTLFIYDSTGYVTSFRATNDIFYELDTSDLERMKLFVGKPNMTTNEAIALARATILKLGYKPEYFGATNPPDWFEGPVKSIVGLLPYCSIKWEHPENEFNKFSVEVDMQSKKVVGLFVDFDVEFAKTNNLSHPQKVDIIPELERDFKKRNTNQLFIRTNAPVKPQSTRIRRIN
jgi:hypothetical protein